MPSVILQSEWAKGREQVATPSEAGVVVTEKFTYTLAANMESDTDIIEIGVLPAGAVITDAILHVDEAGAATWAAGIMSGDVGSTATDRTCGTELFSGAADATVNRMTAIGGFEIASSTSHRSVGVKPSADVTHSSNVVTLILSYTLG